MRRRTLISMIFLMIPALSLGGSTIAQENDRARALRKLDECLNPKPKAMCQYDFNQPCLDALKAGLSAERAAQARHTVALRHLAMARETLLCEFCTPWVRAQCRIKGIQEDVALMNLQEALRVMPTYLEARSTLVHFYVDRSNLVEAYRLAKESVFLQPEAAEGQHLLGYVCLRLKRWDEAMGAYRRAAESDPKRYSTSLGDVATSLDLFREAQDAYQVALRLAPRDPAVYARLAVLEERRGNTAAAEEQFAEVLRLSPDFFQKPYNKTYAEAYERILSRPTNKGATDEAGPPVASGSGFFVTESGHVVTNAHVVAAAHRVLARMADGGLLEATVLALDRGNDLALLKVDGRYAALPLSQEAPRLGAAVAVAGFPNPDMQGLAIKVTRGEINSVTGARDDPRLLQISAQVQPGNSGGPLVDMRGNVIGVIVSRLNDARALKESGSLPQNVNYAIKAAYLAAFLAANVEAKIQLPTPSSRALSMEEVAAKAEKATVLIIAERQ